MQTIYTDTILQLKINPRNYFKVHNNKNNRKILSDANQQMQLTNHANEMECW